MKNRRQKGFTLLEVLISLLIVAVVLVEVMILSSASQKAGLLSGQRLEAYNLAMEQKELLRAAAMDTTSYADWTVYITSFLGADADVSNTCVGLSSAIPPVISMKGNLGVICNERTVDGTKYMVKLEIVNIKPAVLLALPATDANYRKINITVSWPNTLCVGNCGTVPVESVSMSYYITASGYQIEGRL